MPVVLSVTNETDGAPAEPLGNFNPLVSGVCPSAETDCVKAAAMSLRSEFIAVEEITVPGENGA
jgi:hypothetical protein